jgi:hypothetical protein
MRITTYPNSGLRDKLKTARIGIATRQADLHHRVSSDGSQEHAMDSLRPTRGRPSTVVMAVKYAIRIHTIAPYLHAATKRHRAFRIGDMMKAFERRRSTVLADWREWRLFQQRKAAGFYKGIIWTNNEPG